MNETFPAPFLSEVAAKAATSMENTGPRAGLWPVMAPRRAGSERPSVILKAPLMAGTGKSGARARLSSPEID